MLCRALRRHPILGDELYGFKDWNSRYGASQGVKRPLLHAAELIVPLPPLPPPHSAVRLNPRHQGSAVGSAVGSAAGRGGASAVVTPGHDGGPSWLRLRCPPPRDFLGVASEILGAPLAFEALLDGGDPRERPGASRGARAKSSGSGVPSRGVLSLGVSVREHPVLGSAMLANPTLLAQAEAGRGGWFD